MHLHHKRRMHRVCVWMILLLLLLRVDAQTVAIQEEFVEDLLIRPLPDGKALAHFHFSHKLLSVGSLDGHHTLFPKAIFQLVKKFHVKEMELSFTQGRWNYQRWGGFDHITSLNAKPVGVEFWALLDVPKNEVDATWGNLTHALSGLFCASINFLESSTTVAEPRFSFKPESNCIESKSTCDLTNASATEVANGKSNDQNDAPIMFIEEGKITQGTLAKRSNVGHLRYGALPREAVCTENLTPWLKLLPCRDKAGLTTLLDRPTMYNGFYHSQRLNIKSRQFAEGGIILHQTLTLVLPIREKTPKTRASSNYDAHPRDLSLFSLFGKKLEGNCPLAKSSHVYLELEGGLMEQLKEVETSTNYKGIHSTTYPKEMVPEEETEDLERIETDDQSGMPACLDPDLQIPQAINIPGEILTVDQMPKKRHLSGSNSEILFGDGIKLDLRSNKFFNLSTSPCKIHKEANKLMPNDISVKESSLILDYELKTNKSFPFDFGLTWKFEKQLKWPPVRAPFRISRFLAGYGNARGIITTILKANLAQNFKPTTQHQNPCRNLQACLVQEHNSDDMDVERKEQLRVDIKDNVNIQGIDVVIFQVVPWYMRIYWHTLTFIIDGNVVLFENIATMMRLVPAKDRKSPTIMELGIRIPANMTSLIFTTEFDKGFLHIDEHPPDANRGFDIPAAIFSFPGYVSKVNYLDVHNTEGNQSTPSFLQTEEKSLTIYTEILLMQLATPDFSMPYNVITLTCTVLALYFGSLLNVLRRRIGEEERRLAKRGESTKLKHIISKFLGGKKPNFLLFSSKFSKLLKILIVVGVAIAVNFVLNSSK